MFVLAGCLFTVTWNSSFFCDYSPFSVIWHQVLFMALEKVTLSQNKSLGSTLSYLAFTIGRYWWYVGTCFTNGGQGRWWLWRHRRLLRVAMVVGEPRWLCPTRGTCEDDALWIHHEQTRCSPGLVLSFSHMVELLPSTWPQKDIYEVQRASLGEEGSACLFFDP